MEEVGATLKEEPFNAELVKAQYGAAMVVDSCAKYMEHI